jgi:hypothetical protein
VRSGPGKTAKNRKKKKKKKEKKRKKEKVQWSAAKRSRL